MGPYLILREDGRTDSIAGRRFDSYDAAYDVLERYYADLCCSDDRETYRIEPEPMPGADDPAAAPPAPRP